MPGQKKQHFLPQFYMRNFSVDPDQKTISLYLIDGGRHVAQAKIRDQAQRHYFYGTEGMEDVLSVLEGMAAPLIAGALKDSSLPAAQSDDHATLLTFVLCQDARTPSKADEHNEVTEKLAKRVARDFPDTKDIVDSITVKDPEAPVMSLQAMAEICHFAVDLHWKLLVNRTSRFFITSDNPTVMYNQFLEKRNLLGSNTGIASKGLQIFLPIGPRHMLLLYDGDVYRVGGRQRFETAIDMKLESDIAALNTLQAANADGVLYFSADTDLRHVEEAIGRAKPHRRIEKTEVTEHVALGPDGRVGTLIQTSTIDLRVGLVLDCCVILPAAAGTPLNGRPVQLRNPEAVHRHELQMLRQGPHNPRQFLDRVLGRR